MRNSVTKILLDSYIDDSIKRTLELTNCIEKWKYLTVKSLCNNLHMNLEGKILREGDIVFILNQCLTSEKKIGVE